MLKEARKSYPKEDGCEMLYTDGKKKCLIHTTYGWDTKYERCKVYPENGEMCLKEIRDKEISDEEERRQAIINTYKDKIGLEKAIERAEA